MLVPKDSRAQATVHCAFTRTAEFNVVGFIDAQDGRGISFGKNLSFELSQADIPAPSASCSATIRPCV